MTESPPRPEENADEDRSGVFMIPPAPLPVAPWWGSSTLEPAPPEDAQDLLQTASASPMGPSPRPLPGTEQALAQAAPVDAGRGTGPYPLPAPSETSKRQKPKRKPLVVTLCVVVALGMAAAVAAVIVVVAPSSTPETPQYAITAAATAGGLRKNSALPAASAAYPFIIAAARAAGVEGAVKTSAVYRGPVTGGQDVLFLGGTAPISAPGAFLQRARPSTALKVAKAVPAKPGGQMSCGTFAVLSSTHLYCAWATGNTFGFIASNGTTATTQAAGLASLTTRMRADLEKRAN